MPSKAKSKANGKKARFAVVAAPGCTCPYCIMISSRGAVYRTAQTATKARHTNCNCSVMPIPEGTKIEGYDPKALYDQWEALGRSRDIVVGGKTVDYEDWFSSVRKKPTKDWRNHIEVDKDSPLPEVLDAIADKGGVDVSVLTDWLDSAPSLEELRRRCLNIEMFRAWFSDGDWETLQKHSSTRKYQLTAEANGEPVNHDEQHDPIGI